MEVFKSIIWSKEDRHYLNQLDKWMSLCEREELKLNEKEIKAAARFARGSGEIETNLPDTADGLIARPKQAMICLQEAAIEAMGDIDEVINLVHVGLEILRG